MRYRKVLPVERRREKVVGHTHDNDGNAAPGVVEQSSKSNSRLFTVFFWLQVYIFLAIVKTTDTHILRNGNITLPFVPVEVDLWTFYFIAPIILLGFFLLVSFHLKKHQRKLRLLDRSRGDDVSGAAEIKLYPFVYNFLPERLPWLYVFAAMDLLPVFTVLLMLISLSKLQDPIVTMVHFAVLLTLVCHGLVKTWDSCSLHSIKRRCVKLLKCKKEFSSFPSNSPEEIPDEGPSQFRCRTGSISSGDGCKTIYQSAREGWISSLIAALFIPTAMLYAAMVIFPSVHSVVGKIFPIRILNVQVFPSPSIIVRRGELVMQSPPPEIKAAKIIAKESHHPDDMLEFYVGLNYTEYRNFRFADFSSSKLYKADFWHADLRRAILDKTQLQEANMESANMQLSYIGGANLDGAFLSGVRLQAAFLEGANLRGANLPEADLSWAKLQDANLSGADLSVARLKGADLRGSDLRGANLQRADLQGAILGGANLEGAYLMGTNLHGSYLEEARLKGIWGKPVLESSTDWGEDEAWTDWLTHDEKKGFRDEADRAKSRSQDFDEAAVKNLLAQKTSFEKFVEARQKVACGSKLLAERLLKAGENCGLNEKQMREYQSRLRSHIQKKCPDFLNLKR